MIRLATAHDSDAVVRLWTDAYATPKPGERRDPYTEGDYGDAVANGEVFVAEVDGEVVGVVVIYGPGAPGRVIGREGEAELSRLAVAAPSRRAGIGTALVDLCEERARAAGWGAIALWSRPWQTDAHRLYESRGYLRMLERDEVEASGSERWVFRLVFD